MTSDIRNYSIDFLKAMGLLLIILAHVSAPQWIMQVRNFDVPMMVFLSGYLSGASIKRCTGYFSYVKKRIHRLLLPTYIFLLIYFVLRFACNKFPDISIVLKSFLLQNDSIGYVWIIRIYLMSAIIVPFVSKINFSYRRSSFGILLLYFLYEALCQFRVGTSYRIIDSTLFYIIPYGIILILGINYESFSRKTKVFLAFLFTAVFTIIEICYIAKNGEFLFVQQFKYSPRHIYLIHALMWIFVLMLFTKHWAKLGTNKLIIFVSKSSLWIYLWHILVLLLVNNFLSLFWGVKFLAVVFGSVTITFIQNKIIDCAEGKIHPSVLKIFRG